MSVFNSDANLRAAFIATELKSLEKGLPEADSVEERVRRCVAYLLTNSAKNGDNGLLKFIEVLGGDDSSQDFATRRLESLGNAIRAYLETDTSDLTSDSADVANNDTALFLPQLRRLTTNLERVMSQLDGEVSSGEQHSLSYLLSQVSSILWEIEHMCRSGSDNLPQALRITERVAATTKVDQAFQKTLPAANARQLMQSGRNLVSALQDLDQALN